MARKSVIERNRKRMLIAATNYERRTELRTKAKQGDVEAQRQLSRMRRDASPSRVRNRDMIDGRPRGYIRKFGMSRVNFRKRASKGEIPGVTKASW